MMLQIIKEADLIISLTGNRSRLGRLTLRGNDGKPGQMILYYQTPVATTRQHIVFTTFHEIRHYLFGVADEYDYGGLLSARPPRLGPGCLMDNYRPSRETGPPHHVAEDLEGFRLHSGPSRAEQVELHRFSPSDCSPTIC